MEKKNLKIIFWVFKMKNLRVTIIAKFFISGLHLAIDFSAWNIQMKKCMEESTLIKHAARIVGTLFCYFA